MNEKEFRTYLLLYAANADFNLQEEEQEIILSNVTADEFKHVNKVFERHSDYERIETIMSYREKYFPTEEHVEKLLAGINELLFSDENFNINERIFFKMIKKLLRQ